MTSFERLCAALSDRYRVERELGRGGTATVYLAQDLKHSRAVALKVLNPELASSVGAERFLREIQTVAQLSHPHILPLYDSGECDGMLFYVLPYVEGQSLRERLAEKAQLRIAEAVAIASQLADALAYAHSRGIVHRDIKPENILFPTRDHACLADFGLARLLFSSSNERLTSTGLSVGSPLYMSPEQIGGDTGVDGRSDLYSLGCVLFEMLAGQPPFEGPTVQAVLTKHLTTDPPLLSTLRPEVPAAVQVAVHRSLAKRPSDRFSNAGALRETLIDHGSVSDGDAKRRSRPARFRVVIPLVLVAILGILAIATQMNRLHGAPLVPSDTIRIALFPLTTDSSPGNAAEVNSHVHQAFARWSGIQLIDPGDLRDVLSRTDRNSLTSDRAAEISRRLRAGRFVRSTLHGSATGAAITLSLYDALPDRPVVLDTRTIVLGGEVAWDRAIAGVVDSLLFRGAPDFDGFSEEPGTSSVRARHALGKAFAALGEGNLTRADSALMEASQADASFGRAYLWLAQIRAWRGDDHSRWLGPAQRALAHPQRLTPRDATLAAALFSMAEGRYPDACQRYEELVARSPQADFVAWYGLGECLRRDRAVVRDSKSPSGWSFRSSYNRSLESYERAYSIKPSMLAILSAGGFSELRTRMYTSEFQVRGGITEAGDPFLAFAGLAGDTLTFIPHAMRRFNAGDPAIVPHTMEQAVTHQKRRFERLATVWVESAPDSPGAREAHIIALELVGASDILSQLEQERERTRDAALAWKLAVAEVWIRVKRGVPERTGDLDRARFLADSLLSINVQARDDEQLRALAGLAALLGRSEQAARFAERSRIVPPIGRSWPEILDHLSARLEVFAALGGPVDSIRAVEQRLHTGIRDRVPPSEQQSSTLELTSRAAILSFPIHRFRGLEVLATQDAYLAAQVALARGDSTAVRDTLRRILTGRSGLPPSRVSLDIAYAEAALLASLGDLDEAIGRLDPVLRTLESIPHPHLADVIQSALIVRSMTLRADLAAGTRDHDAQMIWDRAVGVLRDSHTPPERSAP